MSSSSDSALLGEQVEEPAAAPTETPWRRSRWGFWLVLLVGILVFSPAIRAPFWLDDYAQIAMSEGSYPAPRGPADLYDFVRQSERDMLVDRGLLPWWTNPRYKLRFFRPLSSSLLWAEHRVTNHQVLVMHLASFAWWAGAVAILLALLRRLFSERVALIAAAIFALAPCHSLPLAWVANREVLVSLVFGLSALLSLSRMASGSVANAALAAVFFALALAGGEYGLCFGGYALAFVVWRSDLTKTKRALALGSFAVPAFVYLAIRASLSYGAEGSGFYHDPLRSPAIFLESAPRRWVTLMVDAWTTIDFDIFGATAPWWAVAVIALVCTVTVVRPIRAAFAELTPVARKDASWLLTGSMIALVPMLAGAPSTRLVAVCVLGVAPIVALVVDRAWYPRAPRDKSGLAQQLRVAAATLAFFHFLHGPTWAFLLARGQRIAANDFAERADWLREHVGDTSHANVIIARAGWDSVLFAPLAIDARGRPPAMWRTLVPSQHALMLRVDANTIDLIIPHGSGFFPITDNDLFRDPETPLHTGEQIVTTGMRVTVIDNGEVGPSRLRFVFDKNPDDPSLTWIIERYDGYRASPPPRIGFGAPLDAFQ